MTLLEFKNFLENNSQPEDKTLKLSTEEDEQVVLQRIGNFKDKKIDLRDFDLTELKPEGNFFNNLGEGYKLIISDKTFGYVETIVEGSYGFKGRFIKLIPNYFKVGEMNMVNFNYIDKIYEDLEKNRNDDRTLEITVEDLKDRVDEIEQGKLKNATAIELGGTNPKYTISVG